MVERTGSSARNAIQAAIVEHGVIATPGIADMATYLAAQVADESHREVLGPLLAGSGASGVVLLGEDVAAAWGDPMVPEMLFSATKSVLSLVAGVAYDRGLLVPEQAVVDRVNLPELAGRWGSVTWEHLLQQTSMWVGELWGKPSTVDAQSTREGDEALGGAPGSGWAYNDVRVNLLALALTRLLRQALPDVLREAVLAPLGVSETWSWHGYGETTLLDGLPVPVVSGGAHWGGGVHMSAHDLARIGRLFLTGGDGLISGDWIQRSWTPCAVKPSYGYLWWLNDTRTVWPSAPPTGRCARGNGGRHLLWVDPARDLVLASHWTEDIESLITTVSQAHDSG